MSKKVLALVLALVMVVAMLPMMAFAADYTDTTGHWAEAQIDRWTEAGVVEGDGTSFNPNGNMTRAEAAKTFANLLKLSKKADLTAYTDVPTAEWKVEALAKAVEKGIIKGMSDTTLVPDGTLTREQMFVMIGRALGIKEETTSTKTFVDGTEVHDWAEGYVNALVNMGAVKGVGHDQLKPTDNINRAGVMSALDQLIGGYANTDGQTVEIVPGKITLIVADEVKVEGTADPDMPIVIAGEAKTVDLEGVTVTDDAAPVVQVQVEEVAIENAPEGTTVAAPAEATDVTVNGETVEAGEEVVVPETETEQTTPPPAPAPAPDPEPEPDTYTVTFYATWGYIVKPEADDPFQDTCYGEENNDGKGFASVTANVEKGGTLGDLIPKVAPRDDWKFLGWTDSSTNVTKENIKYKAKDVGETGKGNTTGELADETLSNLTINADLKLYAVWLDAGGQTCYGGESDDYGNTGSTDPGTITVTCYATWGYFDATGGTVSGNTCYGQGNDDGIVTKVTMTLNEGTTLTAANIPEPKFDDAKFEKFLGWSTDSNTTMTGSEVLTDNMNLYAVYQDKSGSTCYGDENTATGGKGAGTAVPGSGR